MYLCTYMHKSRLGAQASPPPPQELSGLLDPLSSARVRGHPRHSPSPAGPPSRAPTAIASRPSHPLPFAGASPRFPLHPLSHSELPPGTSAGPTGAEAPGSAGSSN